MQWSPLSNRRVTRRAVRAPCYAVALDGWRLLGERVLDMSPYGLLVACDGPVDLGEPVRVSFRAPGSREWFEARAAVARVVEGWRTGDPGYCIGLQFTDISLASRLALQRRLVGHPPPVPARPLRPDYAATVQQIAMA